MVRISPVLDRRRFLALTLASGSYFALPRDARAQQPDGMLGDIGDANWWWDAFRDLTLVGLGSVPGAGGILSFFGGLFIPANPFDNQDKVWKEFIDAINRIVDQKIDDAIYLQVQASLTGFTRATGLFLSALDSGDAQHIRSVIDAMNVAFSTSIAGFMLKGHEGRLLPLFVPVANLHLGLLRQAVQQGRQRGFPPAVIQDYQQQLQASIIDYGKYYDDVVLLQLQAVAKAHPHDSEDNRNQPLAAVYTLRSQLQASLGDVRDCWAYFDTARYPDAVQVRLDRELFTMLIGSYYDDTVPVPMMVDLPPPPTGPIWRLTLQGHDLVDGLTLGYGDGFGPRGVDEVHVGGGGGDYRYYVDVIKRGNIRAVLVRYGYALNTLSVEFGDGSSSDEVGNDYYRRPVTRLEFPGHHLSSVIGFGTASGYGGVLSGCMFGFQLDNQSAPGALDPWVRGRLQRVWPAGLQSALRDWGQG